MSQRVLVVTRNLPPLVGGMERLVWHICDELAHSNEVHVIGPAGCKAHLPTGITASEIPVRPLYRFLGRAAVAALSAARRLRPDVVFAGSGLTAPIAWMTARTVGARCITYLHGLDVEAHNAIYRRVWPPLFRRCDQVLVNSRFTEGLALGVGIPKERIAILHPGVALPDMAETKEQARSFRDRYGLGDAPLMLYVGRITPRKGLARFVDECLPAVVDRIPNAQLVVIGDDANQALVSAEGELPRIRSALHREGLEHRVQFFGNLGFDDPNLQAAYSAADVLVFPVQERPGDNEGFGMVALEAAAHGTPVVAYAVGGVPDAIADQHSGALIPPDNPERFTQAVLAYLRNRADPSLEKQCIEHAAHYRWQRFGQRLVRQCSL